MGGGGVKNTNIWEFSGPADPGDEVSVQDGDVAMPVAADIEASLSDSESEEDETEEETEDQQVVAPDDSCGVGASCSNHDADPSISPILLECDKCNLFYHLFCQGFTSNPFNDDDQKLDSLFYCIECRPDVRMSRRQKTRLVFNFNFNFFT